MKRKHSPPHASQWFIELIEQEYPMVLRIAQSQLVGVGCIHMAEDVTQEVFFAAFLNEEMLKTHPNTKGWLYQTTYKLCNNINRRQLRKISHCAFSIDNPAAPDIEDLASEDKLYAALETVYDVGVAIAYFQSRLSAEENQLFQHRYIEKRTNRELSVQYGISEQAMSMRICRLRRKVCKILEKFFDEALIGQ